MSDCRCTDYSTDAGCPEHGVKSFLAALFGSTEPYHPTENTAPASVATAGQGPKSSEPNQATPNRIESSES